MKARAIADVSIEASKERCKTLAGFVREAWPILEPEATYVHNWHVDAVCQHLEAVTRGEINRLLINVPPGSMKSLMVSVLWNAWEWGPCNMTAMRYVSTSFADKPVTRDTRKCRDLIMSSWYQERWPHVKLVRTGETSFANSDTGTHEGVAFGSLTSQRGDRLTIDDPHSTEMAESDAERSATTRKFREGAQNRLNDQAKSAIVVVMQRLHADDISGVIQQIGMNYTILCLPMEFEVDRKCITSIGWEDPRTYEGELLDPVRFPQSAVDALKRDMGSYAFAGQYQQRPTPRDGGNFKRSWFKIVDDVPASIRWCRYWDLAATKEQRGSTAAYTVGLLLGREPGGRFLIGDIVRMRAEGNGVRRLIKETAEDDGQFVEIGGPIDPGQAGVVQAQDFRDMLAQYVTRFERETGSKEVRADPVAARAEAGDIDLLKADWNEAFLNEAAEFPGGRYKDQIDALSGAYTRLIARGIFGTPESEIAIEDSKVLATWPRLAVIDVTGTQVAIVWVAFNPNNDSMIVYDAIMVQRSNMAVHAQTLRKRCDWCPVLFDLEGDNRSKDEGIAIAQQLADNRIDLMTVRFDEEACVSAMGDRFASQRLRVFKSITPWFEDYRRYSRNEKGKIGRPENGIMRGTGLIVGNGGQDIAITENRAKSDKAGFDLAYQASNRSNSSTGY